MTNEQLIILISSYEHELLKIQRNIEGNLPDSLRDKDGGAEILDELVDFIEHINEMSYKLSK